MDNECLKMGDFAVDATVGPDGLCPTLLVFGVIPTPERISIYISQIDRARSIHSELVDLPTTDPDKANQITFGK